MVLTQDEIKEAILNYANEKYNLESYKRFEFLIEFDYIEKPNAYTENLYKPMMFKKLEIKNINVEIK